MSQLLSDKVVADWQRLVESYRAYLRASQDFLAEKGERVEVLREALRGKDRNVALEMTKSLTADELQQLFPEWIHLSRAAHGPFEPAWKIVLSMPRDWVLTRINREVDAILFNEEEDDYWMFLQLYDQLDRDLTLRLARRAAAHSDPDIRELGEDYLAKLGELPVNGEQRG